MLKISLDPNWKFQRADDSLLLAYERLLVAGDFRVGAPSFLLDDSTWQTIDLPHDFVVNGNFTDSGRKMTDTPQDNPLLWSGSLPGGVGWYRKRFLLHAEDIQRVYLLFDGVFRDCRVYLNQCFVGSHQSGYTSFYFDVTDLVEFGGENLLAVRADANTPEGWFYEGGGIYRHVWLVTAPSVHIAPWGVFATSEVDFSAWQPRATVRVTTTLINKTHQPARPTLTTTLVAPDQQAVGEISTVITIPAGGQIDEVQQISLEAAQLWSLEAPNLYQVVTSLRGNEAVGPNISDTITTSIGIRSIRFDANQGFFLNEQPVKLKGVCCHQDHAGVGAALTDGLQEYRIRKLKEMGCNAYRSAHNPPTPELLDACDRLGMLVMNENRQFSSASENLANLESMIRRDRNHPCVILWSIGNEETIIQHKPQARRIARTLIDHIYQLDSTRPVTLATTFWDTNFVPMIRLPIDAVTTSSELDVMGFNYNEDYWEAYHQQFPAQPIVVSEALSNFRTRGCYQSDDSQCFMAWSNPPSGGAEEEWARVAEASYLSGIFIWTGFDYRGEPYPQGWPGISSNFGVMDTCGFPKDNYFYFKAWWTDEPLIHIFPHWNWPDKIGQPISMGCYSNCEEVEFFLNGSSLGRQKMIPHRHLEWPEVIYTPGMIEVRGYRRGEQVSTYRIETTGPPHAVRLHNDFVEAVSGGIIVVNTAIVDESGRVVPTADAQISFQVQGAARIIGVGNGNPSSHEPDCAPQRRAFHGWCQVILQRGVTTGLVTLTARAPGLLQGQIEIH